MNVEYQNTGVIPHTTIVADNRFRYAHNRDVRMILNVVIRDRSQTLVRGA